MYILLLPIIVLNLAVWAVLIYSAYRGVKAFFRGDNRAAACWLAVVCAPVVLYVVENKYADWREYSRSEEVASWERHALPRNHPRLLEVHGYLPARELIVFLDGLDLDEVYQLQSKPRKGTYRAEVFRLRSNCRGWGKNYLARTLGQSRKRPAAHPKFAKDCLEKTREVVSADRDDIPAIVFRMGHNTTLRLRNNTVWGGGNFEARLRTADGNVLLDYWERPYISRPSSPFLFGPSGLLKMGNSDWKKYRINRVHFFAGAVGLKPKREIASSRHTR